MAALPETVLPSKWATKMKYKLVHYQAKALLQHGHLTTQSQRRRSAVPAPKLSGFGMSVLWSMERLPVPNGLKHICDVSELRASKFDTC